MKNISTYFITALIAAVLGSCAGSGENESTRKAIETPTRKIVSAKDIQWSAQYLPVQFHVQRAEKSGQLTDAQRDSVANEYYPFYYFRVNIAGKPQQPTREVLKYMSYDMQQDFFMTFGNDTVAAMFSQAVATGDPVNHEFMLAFPRIDTAAPVPVSIVFNDQVFGTGRTKCIFNSIDLKD